MMTRAERILRSLVFDGVFYLWTVVFTILACPLLFLPPMSCLKIARLWCRTSLFFMKYILKLDYRVEGELPEGGCVIASRHQSAWETIAFNVIFENPVFVLKRTLVWIPIFGWFLMRCGMISVVRGKVRSQADLTQQARHMLDGGRPIVIFPEGTRTLPGQQKSLKKGVWYFYKNLSVPVVPVRLNSGMFWKRRAWCKAGGVIHVQIGQPIMPGIDDEKLFLTSLKQALSDYGDREDEGQGPESHHIRGAQ